LKNHAGGTDPYPEVVLPFVPTLFVQVSVCVAQEVWLGCKRGFPLMLRTPIKDRPRYGRSKTRLAIVRENLRE